MQSCRQKYTTRKNAPRVGFIAIYSLFLTAFCSLAVMAQTLAINQSRDKLKTIVHLRVGQTTVANVMKAISEQIGVKVLPAEYLQDHRLLMQMDQVSASDVLDTLVDLYGWRWFVNEQGNVVLTGQRPRVPQTPAELPIQAQIIIPRDVQKYLRIQDPSIKPVVKQDNTIDVSMFADNIKIRSQIERQISDLIQKRLVLLESEFSTRADSLPSASSADKLLQLAYTDLTPSMQQGLVKALVLSTLYSAAGSARSFNLLHNNLMPYERDMNSAEIMVKGGIIHIGSSTKSEAGYVHVGFGEGLTSP